MLTQPNIPMWGRFEQAFSSTRLYDNPFQDVTLTVTFSGPDGASRTVEGFWNGGNDWRVRFMPAAQGTWTYETRCSDAANDGLHGKTGSFSCSGPSKLNRFETHGPVGLSADRHYLAHADGTPFFWLGDTAWNGPMCAPPAEWTHYLNTRKAQTFTVVQWVATQWISAPDGDYTGELPYSGHDRILIHPAFFQRLDHKIAAMNRAGLLSAIVMLWAAHWSGADVNARNPGDTLPDDQLVKLARYMLARWGAYHVCWFINGDGDYRGERAARWRQIGRAVFSDSHHAPVSLHPGGMQWPASDFQDEPWMDFVGYQSGHGDADESYAWLVDGPPATEWQREPARPFINVELPYEDHIAYQTGLKHTDVSVRRAIWWSLLVAPTAGVTYGGHGVWAWDDGSGPPIGHPNTGTPRPWREALLLPGAEQLRHLSAMIGDLPWWTLKPAQNLLAEQPGQTRKVGTILVSRGDGVVLAYLPDNDAITLHADDLAGEGHASWIDPRTGRRADAHGEAGSGTLSFETPGPGDWLLLIDYRHAGAARQD